MFVQHAVSSDTSRFVHGVISFLSAGLPGTVRLGRLQGPPNANALLSFHKPPTGNLAASAATGAESALHLVPHRNQHMQPAAQAASSEVRGSGGVPPLHTSVHPFACSLQSVCSAFYRLILSSQWCCRSELSFSPSDHLCNCDHLCNVAT